ncbi:UDP-sugar pyrophosphorylase-like isoform X1 [Carya illinoinensis]|uniref:UDP-sugar pyrophosphorylase-like isoform X1 n=1 Tax=Carya illinoinensis TaxID=32201 RepID=UPI001C723882|nr:UDP-sugar pyrophosphorylase-like isoform X1 [Carya illinoinensis]
MSSTAIESTADTLSRLGINADFASSAPNLHKNLQLLSSGQIELAKVLLEMGQSHLFEHWADPGVDDEEKKGFFDQVDRLNSSYPGGLASYVKSARQLLADSQAGKNPFDGFTPSVPKGEVLTFGDEDFINFEEAGIREAQKAAFVLVAGGLGERLGYNGIKVALSAETASGTCFLQNYIESILALQEASCRLVQGLSPPNGNCDAISGECGCQTRIPFVIMTSDDTHARTIELLESNSYFGMEPAQVKLLKQEKVACLDDNDARLAVEPRNKYRIQTKPHGHGDVHALLFSSGLLKIWHDAGLRWVLFFQDTNGLLFKAIPASLGVSSTRQYHVNSLAVPRRAKEAIGGITKLTHADGRTMVINVEYNQLDPLLRATGQVDGDVNDKTGFSPFPGNINQLILELGPYIEELTKTGGAIKEFVNPKYKDASKTSFKSSTRLECMMQDYPKTLPPSARVGFTVMDAWLAYAPVKNNPEDASKVPKGNPNHSATSGEMAIYRANSLILRKAGVQVANPVRQVFNGQEVEVWPIITWQPKWGPTFAEIKRKVCGNCIISQSSSMVIKGRNVFLEDLSLDGALLIDAVEDAEVKVRGSVQNKGWMLENIDYKDASVPEQLRIRGFRINKVEQLEKNYSEPGKFSLEP